MTRSISHIGTDLFKETTIVVAHIDFNQVVTSKRTPLITIFSNATFIKRERRVTPKGNDAIIVRRETK